MKKTIIIIILAVYIASIAVVNFFGLEIKMFDSITYVTGIQCDSVTFLGDNGKEIKPQIYPNLTLFTFDFIPPPEGTEYTTDPESLASNPNIIQINYEVMPHLADDSSVEFIYDKEVGTAVYHELSGSFIFLKSDVLFDVIIRATDGSNVQTKITIFSHGDGIE